VEWQTIIFKTISEIGSC